MRFGGINYSRQIKKADCALVAFANSLKWAGTKISYLKEFETLSKVFSLKKHGVDVYRFQRLFKHKKRMKSLPYTVVTIENPKIKQIDEHLENSGSILFTYINNNEAAKYHSVLIVKRFGNQGYYFINESKNSTITIVENRTLKKYLKKHCFAFFLTKKVEVK
jgi:hypothetical protein